MDIDIPRIKRRLIALNLASGRVRDRLYGEHNAPQFMGLPGEREAMIAHLRVIRRDAALIIDELGGIA